MAQQSDIDHDKLHQGAIEWLQLLLAIVSIVALAVIYLLLPDNKGAILGLIKNLIPNVIAALLVVPAVYLVATRVGLSLEDRISRAVQRAMVIPSSSSEEEIFPDDIGQAADRIREIVSSKPDKEKVLIEVLGFTAGTFTMTVLRELVISNPGRLRVKIHSVDFTEVDNSLLPHHWKEEAASTENRLRMLCTNRAELEVWHYPEFPFLLGLAIDDSDLFMAYSSWDFDVERIADRKNEYRHYKRNPGTEHHFRLFRNWIDQPRQKLAMRL